MKLISYSKYNKHNCLLNPPPAAPIPAEDPPVQAPAQLEIYITSFKLYFLSIFSAVLLLLLYFIACSYPFVRLILLYFLVLLRWVCFIGSASLACQPSSTSFTPISIDSFNCICFAYSA